MSAACRINHLEINGAAVRTLEKAERHGKREDFTSQARKVREVDPLVYGGIDLMALYERHMDGVRLNAGAKKPVMHAICQWPTHLVVNAETEAAMLKCSIEFMNSRLGGNAVFAARLDRDEDGRHTVDVFATPTYEKVTKKAITRWASSSKHLKALCVKHADEIMERKKGKFTDNLSAQGIALQSEWREYLSELGIELEPKRPKATSAPDRLEPEAYKSQQDRKKLDAYRQKLSDYEYELAKYRDALVAPAYELGVELPPEFNDEITLDLPPPLPPEPEPEDDYRP